LQYGRNADAPADAEGSWAKELLMFVNLRVRLEDKDFPPYVTRTADILKYYAMLLDFEAAGGPVASNFTVIITPDGTELHISKGED
jgi:hypothetical protein